MKFHLLIITVFLASHLTAQEDIKSAILDSTCICIGNAIDDEEDTKFDFEYDFNICMDSLISRLVKLDSLYENTKLVNQFIHDELKDNCNRYNEADSLKRLYSTHTFESLVRPKECAIMRIGTFKNFGEEDGIRIKMTKKFQFIEYPDGTYTKAKIKWLNPCSYKVTRVKSTNANDSKIKPGHEMIVKIIYVEDNTIIFYEMLLNNRVYSGRMIKVSE